MTKHDLVALPIWSFLGQEARSLLMSRFTSLSQLQKDDFYGVLNSLVERLEKVKALQPELSDRQILHLAVSGVVLSLTGKLQTVMRTLDRSYEQQQRHEHLESLEDQL